MKILEAEKKCHRFLFGRFDCDQLSGIFQGINSELVPVLFVYA